MNIYESLKEKRNFNRPGIYSQASVNRFSSAITPVQISSSKFFIMLLSRNINKRWAENEQQPEEDGTHMAVAIDKTLFPVKIRDHVSPNPRSKKVSQGQNHL